MKALFSLTTLVLLISCGGGGAGSSSDPAESAAPTSPPAAAALNLQVASVKNFEFSWVDEQDASFYRVLENADGASGFTQVGGDISQGMESFTLSVPLYDRINAQYVLESCNSAGCTSSPMTTIANQIDEGIGYLKASNTGTSDEFGSVIALSVDGTSLAIGVPKEDSNALGVNGNQGDNSSSSSGAVYVFERTNNAWAQTAYLKASNTHSSMHFGWSLSFNSDASMLAVGALKESNFAQGVNPTALNNAASQSGAVYLFEKSANTWSQTTYFKASNAQQSDQFGAAVSLSADGNVLAVGASSEYSATTGINGNQNDNSSPASGAAYVFERTNNVWAQTAYIKASNTGLTDLFGTTLSLSDDGSVLAVSAIQEQSNGTSQANNSLTAAGAVYMFEKNANVWTQTAYLKASNPDTGDRFGESLSVSGDGSVLVVGAFNEDGNGTGVNTANESDNSRVNAGAVYVFEKNLSTWSQTAYVKPEFNTVSQAKFGMSVSINASGDTFVVGAPSVWSSATGLNGDQADVSLNSAGAAFIFKKTMGIWAQSSYLKASNPGFVDQFGKAVSISNDGNTVAVGAFWESSDATGVNGDDSNDNANKSGAVYLF